MIGNCTNLLAGVNVYLRAMLPNRRIVSELYNTVV
jgi:hypothetical protein